MTLSRIPKSSLKKGMYVESVECPQSVFGKRRFVLESDTDFKTIVGSSAEFILINTAKGAHTRRGGNRAQISDNEASAIARAQVTETLGRSQVALKHNLSGLINGDVKDVTALSGIAREVGGSMSGNPSLFLELTRLRSKDEGTYMHSLSVGALMSAMGRILGYDNETSDLLGVSGILHDFGKLLTPAEILNKQGPLTPSEREEIRNHPEHGYNLLREYQGIPSMVLDVCRYHHEHIDGSGYPHGISGDAISKFVRISTICDVYDALTSHRPYKRPWPSQEAISWMFFRAGTFDPRLLLRLADVVHADVLPAGGE